MLYINSPGGMVTAGLAIYDTMQYVRPDVATICMGQAASMGAFLLAAGAKGKRYALPHARIMIHQPLGGFQGQATDIDIHAKEILRTRDKLNELLVKHTGQPHRAHQERHRARLLHGAARGEGVRPHRRGARAQKAAPARTEVAPGLTRGPHHGVETCATLVTSADRKRDDSTGNTVATSPAPSAASRRRR